MVLNTELRFPVVRVFANKPLGYFIRVDYGWGLEDGVINDGYWNVSLSLDF
ncbi:MAG: hypothetical protein IJM12_02005 [Bacteroidales bacterium]|nr:hypothetical protein [Bacteroidales bacterium]